MNTLFKLIVIALICGQFISANKVRPPLNSDFVNGPWARIGKRSQYNNNECNYFTNFNYSNEKMIRLYIQCLINNLDATESSESNEKNDSRILLNKIKKVLIKKKDTSSEFFNYL
ncbi:unnamed protein product [Brachionus calyciflorus]|uniref:Uncharacterized protein n=1 Tax=Brachionus calyciflorus TaxID=104777 RepID=A0A813MQ46_9BILA|nr:unnamed protein product [Brachionus calyciflorus]